MFSVLSQLRVSESSPRYKGVIQGKNAQQTWPTLIPLFLLQEEKLELQKLLERVPIPVKESIEEPSAKVWHSRELILSNVLML